MDLKRLCDKFNIKGIIRQRVASKCDEYLRLINIRAPGEWRFGQQALRIGCFELANRLLHTSIDRQMCIKLSGLDNKDYIMSLELLQAVLKIENLLTFEELGIQFGCSQIIPFSKELFKNYCENFLKSIPVNQRAHTKFNKSIFKVAAFYMTAKNRKIRIDRKRLLTICGASQADFANVCETFMQLCGKILKNINNKLKEKAKGIEEEILDKEELCDDAEELGNDPEIREIALKRRKDEEWKEQALKSIRQQQQQNVSNSNSRKRVRQSTLNFSKQKKTKKKEK